MGTGSFPGLKWPGRDVDYPAVSSSEVKERVELYLHSPCGPTWPVVGRTLRFMFNKSIVQTHACFHLKVKYSAVYNQ